jgi:hypothetical protein
MSYALFTRDRLKIEKKQSLLRISYQYNRILIRSLLFGGKAVDAQTFLYAHARRYSKEQLFHTIVTWSGSFSWLRCLHSTPGCSTAHL